MSLDLDLDQFSDNNIEIDDVDMAMNNQNQAEKRAHHNALERKRRDHIKGSFNNLRDVIPVIKGEKASRAHVLKSATEYIHTIKTKNHTHQKAIEDLKRQNIILEFQIRLLERMKATSLYTQNQEQAIKTEPEIQTTRNLLN